VVRHLFWIEAAKYNVLPLDNSKIERMDVSNRPSLTKGRSLFTFYSGQVRIPEGSAPDMKNKSFKITAEVEIPEGGAEGVIATQGGRLNGWGLYILAGKLTFHYNLFGVERTTVSSPEKLAAGKHTVVVDFNYDGPGIGKGGTATLLVDGKIVADGKIPRTIPFRISADETLDFGEDTGTPVSEDYKVPFKFTGTLNKVIINLEEAKLNAEDQKAVEEAVGQEAVSE
jgi:hypothetical protein